MANKYLSTYLNDRLAGAIAAIKLLEQRESAYADTDLARFFAEL